MYLIALGFVSNAAIWAEKARKTIKSKQRARVSVGKQILMVTAYSGVMESVGLCLLCLLCTYFKIFDVVFRKA